MKSIHITTQNGYVWRVPAEVVARSRAEHYRDESLTAYQDEYEYTLENDFLLSDWFNNNMNWDEVEEFADCIGFAEKDEPVIGQDETEIIDEA